MLPPAAHEPPAGGLRSRISLPLCCFLAVALRLIGPSLHAAERPNILFLCSDDQRPDTIAALGNPQNRTPNLDRVVREGTVFARAVSAYPICHASRAEFLTGTSVFRNGVGIPGLQKGPRKNQIDPALATWAGTLRAAGYETRFTGKWHNDGQPKERGFAITRGLYSAGGGGKEERPPYVDYQGREATGYRGWTFKTDDGQVELEKGVGLTPLTSRHIADAAIELVRSERAKPFFHLVSFTAPHDPLLTPPDAAHRYDAAQIPVPRNFAPEHPFDHGNSRGRDEIILPFPRTPAAIQRELAAYYAAISDLDAQIGRILAALESTGQLANTLIIFTSDHGLALGSHGLTGKQNLYDHTLGVPLILRGPGIPKGERREAQCYLRDLFPTACEMAGVPIPPTVEGRSLVPALADAKHEIYPFVIGYFLDVQRAIRTPQWKFIHYPQAQRSQLFDLKTDPDELRDLSADPASQAVLAKLRSELFGWLAEHGDPLKLPKREGRKTSTD